MTERSRDTTPARPAKAKPAARRPVTDLESAQGLFSGYSKAGGTRPSGSAVSSLDTAGRGRLIGALQHLYGNAAVQRLIGDDPAVQRDQVTHDAHPALEWKDFKGKVDPTSTFDAATFSGRTGLGISWKVKKDAGVWNAEATINQSSLNLQAFMDRNRSWKRRGHTSAALLAHEQGHFDIDNVLVEKGEVAIKAVAKGAIGTGSAAKQKDAVKDAVDALKLTPPFQLLATTDSVIAQAQSEYDDDPAKGTDHGTKATEQAQWLSDIAGGLPAYPIP